MRIGVGIGIGAASGRGGTNGVTGVSPVVASALLVVNGIVLTLVS